jgi:nitroreductase
MPAGQMMTDETPCIQTQQTRCETGPPVVLGTTRNGFLRLLALGAASLMTGLCRANQPAKKEAETVPPEPLPPPDVKSSPLLQILQRRHTSREYATRPVDRQTLSNLLWAAYGENRPDGKRTAPSAHDWQYIDIYVTDSLGLYRFNAKQHALDLVKSGDIRAQTGLQGFAAVAPISLIMVSDERKLASAGSAELRTLFGAATAGAIMQNIYLFCAANDLNTGVRADIDRSSLQKAMGLTANQKILLAQSVGYDPTQSTGKAGTSPRQ